MKSFVAILAIAGLMMVFPSRRNVGKSGGILDIQR